jgi:L-ascorbate metabolism protein UlaG (beta-lactamase superfamily)
MRPEDLHVTPAWLSPPAHRPPIRVTWLGTAGFAIEHAGTVVLLDPYVSRPSLWRCLRAPLVSDADAVARYAPRADAIVAGHTHFDHVLDVPAIARATGAVVYGSRSCAALCRAEGLPASQVVDVE